MMSASLKRFVVSAALVLSAAGSSLSQQPPCLLPPAELEPTATPAVGFGRDVDLAGDTLVVGDFFSETATVYDRVAGVWSAGQLLSGTSGSQFGGAIATDGTTVAVGAYLEQNRGAVHLYERSGGSWQSVGTLSPATTQNQNFGFSVDMEGERLAVGAVDRAYVYRRSGADWVLEGQPFHVPSIGGIAVDGDTLMVGAPNGFPAPGLIEEFRWNGSSWVAGAQVPTPNGFHDGFGYALALEGDRLLASADDEKEAFVFERQGGVWTLTATLTGAVQALSTKFGQSVDLDGDTAIVGSPREYVGGLKVGTARLFQYAAGSWSPTTVLVGDPAQAGSLGYGVGIDAGTYVLSGFWNPQITGRVWAWSEAPSPASYCTAGTTAIGCQVAIGSAGAPRASAANGFDVEAAGLEGAVQGLFFFGTNGRQANPWGNGTSYQCVVPPVRRTGLQAAGGSPGQCDGAFSLDFNAWMSAHPAKAPPAGTVTQIQTWFRDAGNTSNKTTSLSDALEFTVCL
jgi:hypothetical protein